MTAPQKFQWPPSPQKARALTLQIGMAVDRGRGFTLSDGHLTNGTRAPKWIAALNARKCRDIAWAIFNRLK